MCTKKKRVQETESNNDKEESNSNNTEETSTSINTEHLMACTFHRFNNIKTFTDNIHQNNSQIPFTSHQTLPITTNTNILDTTLSIPHYPHRFLYHNQTKRHYKVAFTTKNTKIQQSDPLNIC